MLGSSRWQVLSDRLFSLRGAATKSIDRAVAELEADMESGTYFLRHGRGARALRSART